LNKEEIYKVCDDVLAHLKNSERKLAPSNMGLHTHISKDKIAIDLLVKHDLIKFIGGVVGFDKYCNITENGLDIDSGIKNYLESKKTTVKTPPHIAQNIIICIVITVVGGLILYYIIDDFL